ncbi:MAG: isoprenylcysteine carboxylmethyltransferase family protein [Clostridia bacterium]|nr:isoprenylcysteine carboxylmethyltransferase family protein [Clostridia bacterium]
MGYQVCAVLIMLAFYGCYFAKMIGQRKRGIRTDQLGRGKQGFVRGIEIGVKIATYGIVAAEAISIGLNASAFPSWVRMTGAALGTLGVIAFEAAVLTMRDSWRAGVSPEEKTELVTRGIYRYSRNPAFLGFDSMYAGIALMFGNVPLMLVTAFAMLMLHLQIVNVEEDFLVASFGETYVAYRGQVNRYIGRRRSA